MLGTKQLTVAIDFYSMKKNKKTITHIYIYMEVNSNQLSNWWQHLHFWENYPL